MILIIQEKDSDIDSYY